MLRCLLLVLACQLLGEIVVDALHVRFPGPVCGMLLLFGWLTFSGGPSDDLASVAAALVDNLGLLFVPAGAAIIGFGALFWGEGLAIGAGILLSTALSIAIAGLVKSAGTRPAIYEQNQVIENAAEASGRTAPMAAPDAGQLYAGE